METDHRENAYLLIVQFGQECITNIVTHLVCSTKSAYEGSW